MAGNAKFHLSSVCPEDLGFAGSSAVGSRGALPGACLNRFGSFRENSNGRDFSSAATIIKGKTNDFPPLSQYMTLEPFTLCDQKYSRSSELKRALGFSFGSISEDNFFGAVHSKPAQTLSIDELKRFREIVQDGNDKARTRVKRLDDSLNKLTAYLRKLQLNERFSAPNFLKSGAQYNVKAPDLMMHKVDDRVKNVLNKRARTPVSDIRAEGRGTGILRQHMVLGKDREGSLSSDSVEEKIRTLPAGGESWDRNMKRKRSVSNGFPRPIDGDEEIKRAMHGRLSSDVGMLSSVAPVLRVSTNVVSGNTKPDGFPSASGSSFRPTPKSETEKVTFTRGLGGMNKERILQKGNNKLNIQDGNYAVNPSLLTKGKASRGSRAGPLVMGNSFSHIASMQDGCEPPNVDKIHPVGGINSHKRAASSESSSPPIAQWGVGQRPQKVSRITKTNIISPTTNDDEAIITSEGCASGGVNGKLPARSMGSNMQQLKVKNEITPSPIEGGETGAVGNNRVGGSELEERVIKGYLYGGSPGFLTNKTNLLVKEEIGDGVRKLGRSGRGPSLSTAKPVRSAKPGSDKNGSKSGRPPLKKQSERKGFTPRLGLVPNRNSSNRAGESDDDREDLLAAAQFTSTANEHARSSSFWKNLESLFSITVDDMSFLIQQLKALEEHQGIPSEMFDMVVMKDTLRKEKLQSGSYGSEGEKPTMSEPLGEHGQDNDLFSNRTFEEGSLYQRVLSALVIEDEYGELEQNNFEGDTLYFDGKENSYSLEDMIFSNGDAHTMCSNTEIPHQVDPLSQEHYELMSMDERLQAELQSIGLHPEIVQPDLAKWEDERFSEEISELKKQFHQEVNKKKLRLERIWKAVEVEKELKQWELEQVAVSRLVVLAYKKLLATRGSSARTGVSKVPRNVALAFVKRTLARCRKFEKTGKSCFSEPPLWDVILAAPPSFTNDGLTDHNLQSQAKAPGSFTIGPELRGPNNDKAGRVSFESYGPILNRGKKKEVLLDNVGNSSPFKPSPLGNNTLGKRSERDGDKDSSAKSSRPSNNNLRGERKAKSKPKPKVSQSSTHPVYPSGNSAANGRKQEGRNIAVDELDAIELGMENALAGHQDLGSWLNFDDDDSLQDLDSMGLEIPMDDISDLSMLL